MLDGSSHHQILNFKDKNKNNIDDGDFSPVLEKPEEYGSQSNEEQKIFSGIKNEENNKAQLKDSVISKILLNLDSKENNKNKTQIIKPKASLAKQIPKPKKSLKGLPSEKNIFNIINKKLFPSKKTSFNLTKKNSNISFNLINSPKKSFNANRSILKNKRRTIVVSTKKRSSQVLDNINSQQNIEDMSGFRRALNSKKKTYKERPNFKVDRNSNVTETFETNQKLTKPKTKQTGISLDFSRASDDFRFSSLIKKNKIKLVKGTVLKNDKSNQEKKTTFIQRVLNDPNIKKKEDLLTIIKKYSFIQSMASLISIVLSIVDIELYNKFSYDYILDKKIDYDKYYEIGKREINSKENLIRAMNGVCSFICLLMTISIFYSKYNFYKKENRKILRRKKKNSFIHEFQTNKTNATKINYKGQISKLVIRSLFNFIFNPPKVNYIFYSYSNNILCIYPINSLFFLLSLIKLYNIFRCIFYFIPVTSTVGKTICQKYKVKMDVKFMFRTLLSKYQLSFPFIIIILLSIFISILLRSIELFSMDISFETINSKKLNNIDLINNDFNIYETLWIFLAFLIRNPRGYLNPKTPFGKILLFITFLISHLFLCMIYYKFNQIMELDRSSYKAYTKLEKLFLPENKENKASDLILSFILLKKYYLKYNTEEIEKKIGNNDKENFDKKKRKSIFFDRFNKEREKNILALRKKKLIFLRIKFFFYLKFSTDINNYKDSYKISRKQPTNVSSLFQNLEDKSDNNLESINAKLSSIDSIETIFERLKTNDNILLIKITKLNRHDNSLMKYLSNIHNYQYKNFSTTKKKGKTEILKNSLLKKSRTKIVNFKSCKAIMDNFE